MRSTVLPLYTPWAWCCALLLWLCAWPASAAAQVAVPPFQSPITDLTHTLSSHQRDELTRQLRELARSKGSQVAVLMVSSTAPETVEQYSLRVAEQWKLGRKGVDDGVLLLIAKDDRAMRIEVGYGLEGALSDAIANRITDDTIAPHFKKGNFYQGIRAGLDDISRVIGGEALPPPDKKKRSTSLSNLVPALFMLSLVVGGLLRALFGKVTGALLTGGAAAALAWWSMGTLLAALLAGIAALLLTLISNGKSLSGFSGSRHRHPHWGGGGFGGGFGGGLGGGGGFGGGGASGRW